LEDPDDEQIVSARRSGHGRQGASGASCEVRRSPSYRAEDCALDDAGTEFARIYTPIAASVGEPLQPGWPVSEIERLISRCGLTVVDHPARADLQWKYFADRTDGLRPYTFETLVAARVT
jgi:hypothetical protein